MKKPSHVVVFDFDGTLIPKQYISCFTVIDNSLPAKYRRELDCLRNDYLPKVKAGRLTPKETKEWVFHSIEIYIASGLTLHKIKEVFSSVCLRTGAKTTLRFLHNHGIPVAIVSYGIKQFIEAVVEQEGIKNLISEIYATTLKTKDDKICGCNPETFVFAGNKGFFSADFANKYGVFASNTLAVGDSAVDANLGCFSDNRLGIAKDKEEKEQIEKYFGEVVITENFDPVMEWLKKKIKTA